jgi:hypothetical protein
MLDSSRDWIVESIPYCEQIELAEMLVTAF